MFRNKWCDDLENSIQCCVCFVCPEPDTHIFQCIKGHIVCQKCMIRKIKCPICQEGWSCMRHRLAEDLTSMVAKMKLELIGPEGDIHKLFCTKTRSIRSQTDKNASADRVSKKESVRSEAITKLRDVVITTVKGASIKHKWRLDNQYHCPVTGCREMGLNNSSMRHHFLKAHGIPCMMLHDTSNVGIKNHPNLSIRKPLINQSFSCQYIWEVVYTRGMDFDRIFSWMNRTFYLKFFTNTNEDLIGYVNVIHQPLSMSPPVREFSYQLLLQCCIQHKDYKMECKVAQISNEYKNVIFLLYIKINKWFVVSLAQGRTMWNLVSGGSRWIGLESGANTSNVAYPVFDMYCKNDSNILACNCKKSSDVLQYE